MTGDLHVSVEGTGPRVLLLHCDAATARSGWRRQRELAERWTLVAPDRPGYGASPATRVDFDTEPAAHRPLLEDGAHLVGHSYGGVVALLLATAAPQLIRSLTVVEPPAFGLSDAPEVAATRAELQELWDEGLDDPFVFYDRFSRSIGERPWPRPPLPASLERGVRALMGEHVPWEARPDLEALAAAPFPVLVVSGGHKAAFETVCDTIARRAEAERAVVPGQRHMVPQVGAPFNELVEAFWRRAEDRSGQTGRAAEWARESSR
ncbi:alpha/beta fold hydrolase [Georgenia subflava]|uniref:alpha/beta fold hydrolase n=1 Tax=Georgenia subflava TaxID=1622177 RepID=UPI00186AFB23|nr:alpha/beta fold hydrolase [Georgenia subflava]